jgi:hypothetical protein
VVCTVDRIMSCFIAVMIFTYGIESELIHCRLQVNMSLPRCHLIFKCRVCVDVMFCILLVSLRFYC